MSDWSDYAREVQAAADSAGRRADTEMKGLKCKIEELEKACKEWSEVSQSNYQRAKAAEAELAVVVEERDEWQSLAEAAIKDDAAKNIHYAEIQAKLANAVEGFEELADCVDDGCFCSEMQMATVMDKARTTLAELKGEQP